jgi:DNA-binding transcriptional MerR regulator
MEPTELELSIGAFSRRSPLSRRVLRLYEQVGVLNPFRVDPHDGYRWYAESQLAIGRLIGMLRTLDVPLAQVADLISALGPTLDEVTRVLPPSESTASVVEPSSEVDNRVADLLGNYWSAIDPPHRLAA